MRLANEELTFNQAGTEIVAVSVDSPGRNEALRRRWRLPFRVLSDPGGEALLRPLDAWNPDERGGIAWPTLFVFSPEGKEVYRFRSRDFADRPDDDDLLEAVRALDLPPVGRGEAPAEAEPQEHDGAFRSDAFGAYFRGVRSSHRALAGRLRDDADRDEARAMSAIAVSFLDAWKERRVATT